MTSKVVRSRQRAANHAAIRRIRNPDRVTLRVPISETLLQMNREQLPLSFKIVDLEMLYGKIPSSFFFLCPLPSPCLRLFPTDSELLVTAALTTLQISSTERVQVCIFCLL